MKTELITNCTHISTRSLRLGFEAEFVYDYTRRQDLLDEIYTLRADLDAGSDGSITGSKLFRSEDDMEVRTPNPPLLVKDTLEILEKMFGIIQKYGYTNNTCGLHLSFSPLDDKVYYSLNPRKLVKRKLWSDIVKDFNRGGNNYCKVIEFQRRKPESCKTKLNKFYDIIYNRRYNIAERVQHNYNDHGNAVNFQNYHEKRQRHSRLEIRAMGNENYEKRFDEIVSYVDKIVAAFKESYDVKFD